MRDKRFIAAHRGGPLQKAQHRQLMIWACGCSEHVVPLLGGPLKEPLQHALSVAKNWAKGNAATGDGMKASVNAHAVARQALDPVSIAVARSIGHAVATAHMADHSLGAALYALKAVHNAGGSTEEERKWQQEQLPPELKELVIAAMRQKEIHFKME